MKLRSLLISLLLPAAVPAWAAAEPATQPVPRPAAPAPSAAQAAAARPTPRRAAQAEPGATARPRPVLPKHMPALSLDEAIDLAFAQNPDLSAAAARIGEAEARVAEAEAGFYPKVQARIDYMYSNNPALAFSSIVAQRRFNFGMNINEPGWVSNFRPEIVGTWNLYRGGQDTALKRAAELGVSAAELERSAMRNRLAAAVTAAYYAVMSAPRQAEVAHRSVETVAAELDHTKARVEEGMALKGDVLSLEVRATEAYENELRAKNSLTVSRSALKTLLGGDSPDLPDVRETEAPVPERAGEFKKLLGQAMDQRPEIVAAARQVEIRQHELDAAKGANLPRVNAYAAYGENGRNPAFSFNRDNGTIGINAEVDIYTGGANNAKISAAERRVVEAEAIREKTRLEIEDELRRAWSALDEAVQRMKVAEAGSASAEEALRLVNEQYHGGTATVTRYLEAETARANASLRAILARFEAQVAEAQVKQAVGHWK